MPMKYFMFALLLSTLLLTGCREPIPISQIKQSDWYRKQLEIVAEKSNNFLVSKELWYGKVSRINSDIVILEQPGCLASQGNKSGKDSIHLWFEKGKVPKNLAVGDWILARMERSLKNQYFVRDYRLLTQVEAVPAQFSGDYERILHLALEHGWHLKVKVRDDGNGLTITHGAPHPTTFYPALGDGDYSNERKDKDEFYSSNDFDFTVHDSALLDNACTNDVALKFVAPGMITVFQNKDQKNIIFRCGYNFDPKIFATITGRYMDEYGPAKIRFPIFRESAGTIAMSPATRNRRNELQQAFDQAGIAGEWRIGDTGNMIFLAKCRDYELNLPWLSSMPVKVKGPTGNGFIFSLSPPRKGPAAISLSHSTRREFYYWLFISGILSWGHGDKQIYHDWNFESGRGLSKYEKMLQSILHTLEECPAEN